MKKSKYRIVAVKKKKQPPKNRLSCAIYWLGALLAAAFLLSPLIIEPGDDTLPSICLALFTILLFAALCEIIDLLHSIQWHIQNR